MWLIRIQALFRSPPSPVLLKWPYILISEIFLNTNNVMLYKI